MTDVLEQVRKVDLTMPLLRARSDPQAGIGVALLATVAVELDGPIGGAESSLTQIVLDAIADSVDLILNEGFCGEPSHAVPLTCKRGAPSRFRLALRP